MKPLNHYSVLSYLSKKGHTIIEGLDMFTEHVKISHEEYNNLAKYFDLHSQNTNIEFFEDAFFMGCEFAAFFDYSRQGQTITLWQYTGELFFPCCQLFFSRQDCHVTIYGLAFRWYELNHGTTLVFDSIGRYMQLFYQYFPTGMTMINSLYTSRIDYKFDIFNISPKDYHTLLKKYNDSKLGGRSGKVYINKGVTNTFYIGSKGSSNAYCRIYNKALDTVNKGKQKYYDDFPETTTRVEFQFGKDFCSGSSYSELLNKINLYIGNKKGTKVGNYFDRGLVKSEYITNIPKHKSQLRTLILKGINNGVDYREDFEWINSKQRIYNLRINRRIDKDSNEQNDLRDNPSYKQQQLAITIDVKNNHIDNQK